MPTTPVFGAEIKQMMYVAGETGDPSLETISLIESIIKSQVIHIISCAGELAARRGTRAFSNNDIIFQFRHDTARVERLQKILLLKSLRKVSRDDEEDGKDQADEVADDGLTQDPGTAAAPAAVAAPRIPWDINSIYSVQPPYAPGELDADTLDDQGEAGNLQRLRAADRKTITMTLDEYATWSEYRHASFTKRRVPRFRQWCGLGVIADHKASDDVLDILGFLTSEMVQRLTMLARDVQEQETRHRGAIQSATGDASKLNKMLESPFALDHYKETRAEVNVQHIRRAYELTQTRGITRGGIRKRELHLI